MIYFLQQPANAIILQAVGRLFLISFIGYLAVRLRLLSAGTIKSLSAFVIAIALPSLIISTLGRDLRYDLLPEMASCFVAGALLNGLGLTFALTVRRLFLPPLQSGRRLFLTLASLQNSGYLPIPLTASILTEDQRANGLLLVFVYIFVMGFIFWSLGVRLIARPQASGSLMVILRQVANPPLIAMLIGLFFLNPTLQSEYARCTLLQEGLTAVGSTTIPLVLIILGGSFATIAGTATGRSIVTLAAIIKLIVIPSMALVTAVLFSFDRIFAFVLVLQGAMPAAMNHIVVAQEYGGDVVLTSRALFIQYLLSLLTVPIFLLLYNWFYL